MRRVTPPRVSTTKPLESASAARREADACNASVPGTLRRAGTLSEIPWPVELGCRLTFQLPAPPPASASCTRRVADWPRRRKPNEKLVGSAKTSGSSARGSQIIPPPSRVGSTSPEWPVTGFPVSASADLTSATDQLGCRCSSSAAAPATWGEAMLVPSNSRQVPRWRGTDERIETPGAVTSGFRLSEYGVGPEDEKIAIAPRLVAAPTVIAREAEPGESIVP